MGLVCEFHEFIFQRPNYPPPPIVETISYPCATRLLYSKNTFPYKLLIVLIWNIGLNILDNYLEYIIHSYIYTFLLLDTHIFVHGTGADPGIFVRRVIGKSSENFDKQKKKSINKW